MINRTRGWFLEFGLKLNIYIARKIYCRPLGLKLLTTTTNSFSSFNVVRYKYVSIIFKLCFIKSKT
jgi:hypothetical protein